MNTKAIFTFWVCLFMFGCMGENPMGSDESSTVTDLTGRGGGLEYTPGLTLSGGPVVEVPAGSVDELASAIAEAGVGGVVLLKSGQHHESNTVEINHTVSIVGEAGATLISDTEPEFTTKNMDPALYIHNAANVAVRGLKIVPKGATGGTAVYVEDSHHARISDNTILEHERGVIVHHGDHASIRNNRIVSSTGWQTGQLGFTEGVLILNGKFAEISGNDVSNALVGIFVSDRKGLVADNNAHGNLLGIVLCNHTVSIPTPGGEIVGSETNATGWIVRGNRSHDNLDIGYLVIDGANANYLANNQGGNNVSYDIELAGDTNRFGFFTPTSRETIVATGKYGDLIVKDCGVDDKVVGGRQVDTSADPCN